MHRIAPLGIISSLGWLTLIPSLSSGANSASDQGSHYTTATWVNGSNFGTGFAPWAFGVGGSGYLIGSSLSLGGGADIGQSFGFAGGANGSADRTLTGGVLSDGQSFSLDMAVNFRSGYKGISIKNGSTDIFRLTISGDNYQFNDSNISGLSGASGNWGYSNNTVLSLTVTRSGADLVVDVDRSGALTAGYSAVMSGSGPNFDQFSIYSFSSNAGNEDRVFYNNLAIIPEPQTFVYLCGGFLVFICLRARQNHRCPVPIALPSGK